MNLHDQLLAVYDTHGRLTPADVVDDARPDAHPLHPRFEWDDTLAGEAWRREQASQLIRSVRVIYRKPDTDQVLEVRAFHAVTRTDGHGYEPNEKVLADPLLRELVLRDMEREWRQLHARYATFLEFYKLVRADLAKAS